MKHFTESLSVMPDVVMAIAKVSGKCSTLTPCSIIVPDYLTTKFGTDNYISDSAISAVKPISMKLAQQGVLPI